MENCSFTVLSLTKWNSEHKVYQMNIINIFKGPVMKLYPWDQAATVFYKFTASADKSCHPFSGDCESKTYRRKIFFQFA
ncbi:hypothetical protein YC2023_113930 [Brassica napus]